MSATIVALTELIGRPVRDAAGRVAGRVADLLLLPHEHSSRVASFVVRTGTADRLVPTGDIAPLSGPSLYASSDSTTLRPCTSMIC